MACAARFGRRLRCSKLRVSDFERILLAAVQVIQRIAYTRCFLGFLVLLLLAAVPLLVLPVGAQLGFRSHCHCARNQLLDMTAIFPVSDAWRHFLVGSSRHLLLAWLCLVLPVGAFLEFWDQCQWLRNHLPDVSTIFLLGDTRRRFLFRFARRLLHGLLCLLGKRSHLRQQIFHGRCASGFLVRKSRGGAEELSHLQPIVHLRLAPRRALICLAAGDSASGFLKSWTTKSCRQVLDHGMCPH
mmetsp:Transcript_156433/g.501909  ORF Transcript_156433/g.501909 Transcript_156433/m.501909 type:complete len:242 (+) Transcript_156433:893-1618(+)